MQSPTIIASLHRTIGLGDGGVHDGHVDTQSHQVRIMKASASPILMPKALNNRRHSVIDGRVFLRERPFTHAVFSELLEYPFRQDTWQARGRGFIFGEEDLCVSVWSGA